MNQRTIQNIHYLPIISSTNAMHPSYKCISKSRLIIYINLKEISPQLRRRFDYALSSPYPPESNPLLSPEPVHTTRKERWQIACVWERDKYRSVISDQNLCGGVYMRVVAVASYLLLLLLLLCFYLCGEEMWL